MSAKWSPINSFFFFINFNISSVFGIKDTLLSLNPSGLHSQTPRPGAVEAWLRSTATGSRPLGYFSSIAKVDEN